MTEEIKTSVPVGFALCKWSTPTSETHTIIQGDEYHRSTYVFEKKNEYQCLLPIDLADAYDHKDNAKHPIVKVIVKV